MCIPLGGFGPQMPPIPPNEKAKKIGDYLKVTIVLQFILAVVFFVVVSWLQGIFDIFGALIGYMAIRHPAGYNFQGIICYTMFCGMEFVWAIVRLILYFADVESAPETAWQLYLYVGAVIAGPIIYFLGCYLGYQLHKELRNMMLDPSLVAPGEDYEGGAPGGGMYGQGMGGGMQQPQQQQQQQQPAAWRHPEVHPPASAGFRAFQGQGHKLGAGGQ